jgi:hypothetical protein
MDLPNVVLYEECIGLAGGRSVIQWCKMVDFLTSMLLRQCLYLILIILWKYCFPNKRTTGPNKTTEQILLFEKTVFVLTAQAKR